jgi:sodium-dependent phosphate transporter
MVLDAYTYVFALGTCFALLEAYNNGASMSLFSPVPFSLQAVSLTSMSLQTMSPTPGPPVSRRGP